MRYSVPSAADWSYHPYRPFLFDRGEIFVTRIVPDKTSFSIEWLTEESVEIHYGKWQDDTVYTKTAQGTSAVVEDLEPETDYQFQLKTADGRQSLVRLVRTGDYLYTPIQYLHPEDPAYGFSGKCLGSPSIVRQADGSLLASTDVFGSGTTQNLSMVYRSDDDGKTWHFTCELYPCFWGNLFVHRGVTYMLACSNGHGDILISKTTDGGYTFTKPTVLFRGSCHQALPGPDTGSQPPYEYNGRLWFNFHWGTWTFEDKHHLVLGSAPADCDLLQLENWTITPPCLYDENWPGTAVGTSYGTLEGSFLTLPDGKLYILTRYDNTVCVPDYGLAILYRVQSDDPSLPAVFDRTIPFPANHSKFTVQQDPKTGRYYTIANRLKDSANKMSRNLLSVFCSEDGVQWELVKDLIDYSDRDATKHGFQYVDYFIEGEDLYLVCRAAVNNARNYHDSNATLFHKISDFRKL